MLGFTAGKDDSRTRRILSLALLTILVFWTGFWCANPANRDSFNQIFVNGANFVSFLGSLLVAALFALLVIGYRKNRSTGWVVALCVMSALVAILFTTYLTNIGRGWSVFLMPGLFAILFIIFAYGTLATGNLRDFRSALPRRSASTSAPASSSSTSTSSSPSSRPARPASSSSTPTGLSGAPKVTY